MSLTPLFSIIIPVYNVKEYLAACLDSLTAQTLQDFEVIIVDDVSTDGSKDIALDYAKRYPDQFKVIAHQVNTRQGGARNTGIEVASGKYIMFIDSDDYIKPHTLQLLADTLDTQQAEIVEFCHEQVDEQNKLLRQDQWPSHLPAPCVYDKPMLVSGMGPCNKVYLATLFDDPQMRFPEHYYYEDFWLVPQLLMVANKVYYLADHLYCYRQRTGSTIHDTNAKKNKDIMICMDALLKYFHEKQFSQQVLLQLEYLAISQVLLHATLRVNSIDPNSPIQLELKQYVEKNFPNYRSNPYRNLLSKRYQRLLEYIEKGQYRRLHLQWHLRNRVTGTLKQFLRELKRA